MLQISARQMAYLENDSRKRYVTGVLEHEFPLLSRTLRADLKKEFAIRVADKLCRYELRTAYAQRGFIKCAAICGSDFDEDPIIIDPMQILTDRSIPDVARIIDLRRWILGFRDVVYGARYEHYLRALHRVANLSPDILRIVNTPDKLIHCGRALFPTMAEWLTPGREWKMLQHCHLYIKRVGRSSDAEFSLVATAYACCLFLGSNCLDDPLHDYVRTMINSDSANKAQELFGYSIKRAHSEIRSFAGRG